MTLNEDFNYETQECSICLDELINDEVVVQLNNCKHYYHKDCVIQYLRKKRICPMCKSETNFMILFTEKLNKQVKKVTMKKIKLY